MTADFTNFPPWLHKTPIAISIGKRDTHADIKSQHDTTLATWLKGQTGTKREGVMTAAEYAAATKAQRVADKARVGWYSISHYNNNRRSGENWTGTITCVLDADAKHGNLEGAQYSFSADELVRRLDGLQFVALPTHSYTDECPRWRIVVPLSETVTDRSEFGAIAKHISKRLDGFVDPRTYTPEQYWFSLSAPKGEWEKRLGLIVVGG